MNPVLKKERSFESPPPVEDHPKNLARGQQTKGYGRAFWLAYVSNFLISVAVSILYRYADFVRLLGGNEYQLGWIVGVGMVGSLTARLTLGSGIDRRGSKSVWLVSLVAFCLICFVHLWLTRPDTPAIYFLRVAYCLAVAGIFGATITFVSNRMPVEKMAERIGMLGTAGFMGMVVGGQMGDWLCQADPLTRAHADRLFVVAGLIGLGAIAFALLATAKVRPPHIRHRQPSLGYVLWRYQPGSILAIAVIGGTALGWPSTFLATYAAEVGISRIGTFFTVYSLTAIITRVVTRQWPERFGLPPLVFGGLAIMAGSQPLFLFVQHEWSFILPGLTYGIGHAILFPTVVASGCRTFPKRYRGLATMLVMAAFDLGVMIGSPLVGAIIHYTPKLGLPGYGSFFVLLGIVLAGATILYGIASWKAALSPSVGPGHRRRKTHAGPLPQRQASSSEARFPGSPKELGPSLGPLPASAPPCQPQSPARPTFLDAPGGNLCREACEKSPASSQPIHQAG